MIPVFNSKISVFSVTGNKLQSDMGEEVALWLWGLNMPTGSKAKKKLRPKISAGAFLVNSNGKVSKWCHDSIIN